VLQTNFSYGQQRGNADIASARKLRLPAPIAADVTLPNPLPALQQLDRTALGHCNLLRGLPALEHDRARLNRKGIPIGREI